MPDLILTLCLLGAFSLFPLIIRFGRASIQERSRYKSGQVGMFIYRNHLVKGYENYDGLDRLMSRMMIHRDDTGHMVSRICFDPSGAMLKRFEYEVDKNGLMTKKTRFDRDNQMSWYAVYQYDEVGHRTEQCNYHPQGSPTTKVTFYYDSLGERIRNEVYDAEGRPIKIHIYLYDERHRRIRDLTFDLTGEILGGTKYFYGDSGFIFRIEYIDKNGGLEGYNEIDCDSDGNRLVKRDYDSSGTLKSTTKYLY